MICQSITAPAILYIHKSVSPVVSPLSVHFLIHTVIPSGSCNDTACCYTPSGGTKFFPLETHTSIGYRSMVSKGGNSTRLNSSSLLLAILLASIVSPSGRNNVQLNTKCRAEQVNISTMHQMRDKYQLLYNRNPREGKSNHIF